MLVNQAPILSVLVDKLTSLYQQKPKKDVVVIGSGWGASAFVSHIDKTQYNVKVVSTSKRRLNQPRLIPDFEPSYTSLAVEPVIDTCKSIVKDKKYVVGARDDYKYDYLVIATGSEPNDFGTKGVAQNCLMFKTPRDLQLLKSRLINQKQATVIGAGPTGIELAFKLHSMGFQVTVIEASPDILPGFSETMKQYAKTLLSERSINVVTNMKITEVNQTEIKTLNSSTRRDDVVIWTCGVKPTSFVEGKPLLTDDYLMVDQDVYALGDIVAKKGPPTAQNAKQQGIFLAQYFNSGFIKKQPYIYKEKGRVLDTSDGLIVEYMGHVLTLPSFLRSVFYFVAD